MTNFLIAIMIGCIIGGVYMLCFAVEFFGDGLEIQDHSVDWPKAIGGIGLLLIAAGIAAAEWPV